jgi:hypothetical protein
VAAGHRRGKQQQPGADFNVGGFGSFQVDVKTNFVLHEVEAYHPAVCQEVWSFSHREDPHPAQTLEDIGLAPRFVTAKEKEVASLDLPRLTYQANVKNTGSQGLSVDGTLELHAARLVFEDAKCQGRIAGRQDSGRPIYKLREVE